MNYQQSVANTYFHKEDPFRFMALSKLSMPLSEEWSPNIEAPVFGQVEGPHKTVSELLFQMMDHRNVEVGQTGTLHHHVTAEPESLVKAHNDAVKQGASMHQLSLVKHTYDQLHHTKPASTKRLANGAFINTIY